MSVQKISRATLDKILAGRTIPSANSRLNQHKIVVKFYGNNCHLCRALHDTYVQISSEVDDIIFYAFNMEDGNGLERALNFEGVPSICFIDVKDGVVKTKAMPDPVDPDKKTWFTKDQIIDFIKKESLS